MKNFKDIFQWLVDHDEQFFTMVIGLVIALVGPLITFYVGRSTDFHCVRSGESQIRCDVTYKLLGLTPIDDRRVDGIQQAEVEENVDSSGDSTYRVILVTDAGRVALTNSFSSGKAPKADLVNRMNAFITANEPSSLDVQVAIEWWIWLLFFGSILLGLGMILSSLKKFIT